MDPQKKSRADLNSLPTRQYLDQTVNPILLPALKGSMLKQICEDKKEDFNFFLIPALAKERPADPVAFLIGQLTKVKTKTEDS